MKVTTFCRLIGRTSSWGYSQIKKGKLKVKTDKTHIIVGISRDLYFDLVEKELVEQEVKDWLKKIVFD